ncbi:tRNA-dihydrouridine synthase family protein [Desulfobacterales bacterium HSG16]|nr:tRNA-dihydrouridine synthase family protein [Desulfobacterales bacterium HSG16]
MSHKLYLAPMRGLTDHIFRNTFFRFFSGFDTAIAPFVPTVQGKRIRPNLIRGLMPENNTGIPVIPQILGKSADDFIFMAKRLDKFGYDTLNWNLGCPFPAVAKKGRGSGLLPYPDKIDAFLEKTVPGISQKISVKVRLGRHKPNEIFKLMPIFNKYPLKEMIIHPRLGIQMYSGQPDLDTFGLCLEQSRHPVVYNGDIRSYADFLRLSEKFPAIDRWMIGRGVLINPFLADIIKKGSDDFVDKPAMMKQFHDALFEAYQAVFCGPAHLVDRMKGFWLYFGQAFSDSETVVKKINKTREPEKYKAIVNDFFTNNKKWIA